jgi:hypothetical protein
MVKTMSRVAAIVSRRPRELGLTHEDAVRIIPHRPYGNASALQRRKVLGSASTKRFRTTCT